MSQYLTPVVQRFEADVDGYIAKVEAAEAAQGKFDKKSKQSSEQVKKDEKAKEKAVSDYDRLFGSKLKDQENALVTLRRELDLSKRKVEDLRTEFAKTGKSGLFEDIKNAESDFQKLSSIAETLVPNFTKAGSDAGSKAGEGFISQFTGVIGEAGPYVMAALVAVAVLSAPAIAAVVNGALLTGVGLGGFAVGLMMAIKDARTRRALDGLKSTISDVFHNATSAFVAPITTGVDYISAVFDRAGPGLKSTFDELATVAGPLMTAFGDFIAEALPGLEEGLKASVPVLQTFADVLPGLGKTIGDMFRSFGKGVPAAIVGIKFIVGGLEWLLNSVGGFVRVGSQLFIWLGNKFADFLDLLAGGAKAFDWLPLWGDNLDTAADKLHTLSGRIRDASTATGDLQTGAQGAIQPITSLDGTIVKAKKDLQDLVDVTNTWISTSESADDAYLAMKTAISDFNEGVKKGSKYWDINTRAGQANVGLLNKETAAITANYDALSKKHPLSAQQVKDEIAAAQKLYDTAKAAGASKDELSTLKGIISGLNGELAALDKTKVNYYVQGHYTTTGNRINPNSLSAKATFGDGGVVAAANGLVSGVLPPRHPGTLMVLAGERKTKGEVFMPLAGISQGRAMDLAQVAGNAHGFDVVPRRPMMPSVGYGGGGATQTVIPTIVVQLGGKQMAVVHGGMMQYSQRFKKRTGTTGLT